MRCSEEQFNQIKPILEKHDVIFNSISSFNNCNYLTNNYSNFLNCISNTYESNKHNYGRIVFEKWDENTFLEFCDIKITKELPELPEVFCIKHDSSNPLWDKYINWLNEKFNENYRGHFTDTYYGINNNGGHGCYHNPITFGPTCKELTLEEWDSIVNKQQTINTMQKLTVPIVSVLEIHKMACSAWKTTISGYLSRVDSNQNITFTPKEVDTMFNAATKEQLPKLEEIFGKKAKPINYDKIKTGSRVMLKRTDRLCSGLSNCDINKPFDVVFYKTAQSIGSNGNFSMKGARSHYCTFHQDGKFTLFSAHENVDYIVEVIEY